MAALLEHVIDPDCIDLVMEVWEDLECPELIEVACAVCGEMLYSGDYVYQCFACHKIVCEECARNRSDYSEYGQCLKCWEKVALRKWNRAAAEATQNASHNKGEDHDTNRLDSVLPAADRGGVCPQRDGAGSAEAVAKR